MSDRGSVDNSGSAGSAETSAPTGTAENTAATTQDSTVTNDSSSQNNSAESQSNTQRTTQRPDVGRAKEAESKAGKVAVEAAESTLAATKAYHAAKNQADKEAAGAAIDAAENAARKASKAKGSAIREQQQQQTPMPRSKLAPPRKIDNSRFFVKDQEAREKGPEKGGEKGEKEVKPERPEKSNRNRSGTGKEGHKEPPDAKADRRSRDKKVQTNDRVIPKTRPLPDSSAVRVYHGLPRPDGSLNPEAGWSRAMRSRAWNLNRALPEIEKQRQELDLTKGEFEVTIKEEAEDVRRATKGDIPKRLRDLERKSGKVHSLIKKHRRYGELARNADRKASAASHRVEEAIQNNQAAEDAVKRHEASTKKESLKVKRRQLELRIASREESISLMVDSAAAAAQGKAADKALEHGTKLVKEILGGMTHLERVELMEMDSKITALEKEIETLKGSELEHKLQATKAQLEEAFDEHIAARQLARIWERSQLSVLDQLVTEEIKHGTGTMFQELRDYSDRARKAGYDLRVKTSKYLTTIQSPPLAGIGKLPEMVDADIKHVEIYGPHDETWLRAAASTKRYFEQFEQWQKTEIATHRELRDILAQGHHVFLVDEIMAIADKSLGGTSYEVPLVR